MTWPYISRTVVGVFDVRWLYVGGMLSVQGPTYVWIVYEEVRVSWVNRHDTIHV